MTQAFLLAFGIIIIFLVILDIVETTLSPRGAGILTKHVISGTWRLALYLSGRNGSQQLLDYVTVFISISMLTLWIALLWMGNSLILISDFDSVITTSRVPASTIDKVYFAGYVLSTLGNGSLIPGSEFWKIYTALLSFTGLLLITIGITYLVPLLQAEIQRRNLCLHIASLGTSPEDFLISNWNGKDFSQLNGHFDDLRKEISYLGQNHRAYPLLHHSHSHIKQKSTPITMSILDEALTIMIYCLPDNTWPNESSLKALRNAITSYLSTLNNAFIQPSKDAPEQPDYDNLIKAGLPVTKDQEKIFDCYKSNGPRRKLLLGLLYTDGWQWSDLQLRSFQIHDT